MRIAAVAGVVLAMAAFPVDAASGLSGRVTCSDVSVPGATVTATKGGQVASTLSDEAGAFQFANLDDGDWTIRVDMPGFVTASRDVTLPRAADAEPLTFALTMRSYAEIMQSSPALTAPAPGAVAAPTPDPSLAATEPDQVDIITGSVINGAATPFAQPRSFGNNRPRRASLWNFGLTAIGGDSAWNARPFSFGVPNPPAPSYGNLQLGVNVAGPLRIPWLVQYGPAMTLGYLHTDSHTATTASAVMPTAAERMGDFSALPEVIRDPLTGLPFPGNVIPASRISPQAAALLSYYPSPTSADTTGPNFQTPIVAATSSDRFQFGMNKSWRNGMSMDGNVAWQRSATATANLFDFDDTSRQSTLTTNLNWSRQYSARLVVRARYQFTRSAASEAPFFAGRTNVSGDAGITGNDQDPASWGPPTLVFPAVAGLTDGAPQRTVTTTQAPGGEVLIRHAGHNLTIGGDYRWNLVDVQSQPDPRGTLTFTGAASGDAFADFLLGAPTASSIAFGMTATHLRGVSPDAYVNDDWRPLATLTVNAGLRYEYDAPFTESSGHLANLDVAPDFSAIAPVLATDPTGPLTGARYPTSLIRPDMHGLEPRLGLSWRPTLSSLMVFKASYGVYRNLGGYQSLALLLSQQAPFAKTYDIQNTTAAPLTLANPFPASLPTTTTNTFAVDPNVRVADAQNWQVSMQQELPASLTLLVAYLGAKGTHLMQAFLPNTEPPGSVTASTGPSGFVDVASNGTSLRNALQASLRRRLYAGLTASVQYTLAKATDDAASFSNGAITPAAMSIAQNWLDLGAERGPSSFDQRHHVDALFQYTTGVGLKGGTLVDGFWGSLWKDWTVATQLSAGTGLPFTPIAFLSVSGTGIVGIRPSLTGVSPAPVSPGSFANPAAFTAPAPGSWGDAGRNSLRGPAQFSMDVSVSRVFRLGDRLNLEWRIGATNALNRVTFSTIDAIVGSPQFGLPTLANPMRALKMTVRLRFWMRHPRACCHRELSSRCQLSSPARAAAASAADVPGGRAPGRPDRQRQRPRRAARRGSLSQRLRRH